MLFFRTPGGIYRHQGKGGQGDNPWPNVQARPRPYGRENAAIATFLRPYYDHACAAACRALSCHPLLAASPGFGFWVPF